MQVQSNSKFKIQQNFRLNNKNQHMNLKASSLTYSNSPSINLEHKQSYDQLLNLKSTLLHMQFLYCSVSQKLQNQFINQQNQHKDHLIQCFNLQQQVEQLKNANYMKLFIVKLEEILALEQSKNQFLLYQNQQSVNNQIKKPNLNLNANANQINLVSPSQNEKEAHPEISLSQQFQLIPKLDKFLTYVQIKEQQMQQSLCKLYIGNKVLFDLEKTSKNIQKIEQKMDAFLQKNQQTFKKYNYRVIQLQQTKASFKTYLKSIQQEIEQLSGGKKVQPQSTQEKLKLSLKQGEKHNKYKNKQYQKHLKFKLVQQSDGMQKKIETLKNHLLYFD